MTRLAIALFLAVIAVIWTVPGFSDPPNVTVIGKNGTAYVDSGVLKQ